MFKTMLDRLRRRGAPVYGLGVLYGALFLCMQFRAQATTEPKFVSEPEALSHLQRTVDPMYPPIALAARVSGEVRISVSIDAKGQVASEKVLSGPAMLQQTSLDAVRGWRFAPFIVDGAPEPVTSVVTFLFQLDGRGPTDKQEKAARAWFPVFDKCRSAVKAGSGADSLSYCEQALEISLQAGDLTSRDQLARLNSHQLYGQALLTAGDAKTALEQENLAIKEAGKCLTDKDEFYVKLYFWRAAAETALGNKTSALADYQDAEKICRLAIASLSEMKATYNVDLAVVLKAHATLLDSMGDTADAEKLRTEAATL